MVLTLLCYFPTYHISTIHLKGYIEVLASVVNFEYYSNR
jgi:hypothetical protein